MTRTQRFATAIVLLVVLGVAAAIPTLAKDENGFWTAHAEGGPSSVAVPLGKGGDHVGYVNHVWNGATSTWQLDGQWGLRLEAEHEVFDQTGAPHKAIMVSWSDPAQTYGPRTSIILAVDLATRAIGGLEYEWEKSRKFVFKPDIIEGVPQPKYVGPLRFTGHTVALGDDLSNAGLEHFQNGWGVGAAAGHVLAFNERVDRRGVVDGREALGIHAKAQVSLTQSIVSNGIDLPRGARVQFERTVWLSAGVPYPVLTEIRLTINGAEILQKRSTLALYNPGKVPFTWDECETEHYRAFDPEAGQSGDDARYPADGEGLRLNYPLGRALANVLGDASLVEFSSWRSAHPTSQLVSAGFGYVWVARPYRVPYDSFSAEAFGWRLVFATPTGEGYEVWSVRDPRSGSTSNHDNKALAAPRFRLHDLPVNPVTLAYVENLWRNVASTNYSRETPNDVGWGLRGNWGGAPSVPPIQSGWSGANVSQLSVMKYGFEALSPNPGNGIANRSILTVNTRDGRMVELLEQRLGDDWILGALAGADSPAGPGGHDLATIAGDGTSSTLLLGLGGLGILGALAAAYFWPILKYIGAPFFVPGYAKIRKTELLDNKIRERLVDAVTADPGISPPELQRITGAGWSTIVYHLMVLEKNKILSSLIDGRHKRFFPVYAIGWNERSRLAILRNEKTRRLYEQVMAEPGITQKTLFGHLGVNQATARWHMQRLEGAGLVGRNRLGRHVHYFPASAAPAARSANSMEVA